MNAPPIKLGEGEVALLQARHVLNEAEQNLKSPGNQEVDELGNIVIRVHPYAWGLFKTTILKALRGREDLRRRNPHLFVDDTPCPYCDGSGYHPIPVGSARYLDHFDGNDKADDWGKDLWSFCSPCQGSGIFTKLNREWEEAHPEEIEKRKAQAAKDKKGEL